MHRIPRETGALSRAPPQVPPSPISAKTGNLSMYAISSRSGFFFEMCCMRRVRAHGTVVLCWTGANWLHIIHTYVCQEGICANVSWKVYAFLGFGGHLDESRRRMARGWYTITDWMGPPLYSHSPWLYNCLQFLLYHRSEFEFSSHHPNASPPILYQHGYIRVCSHLHTQPHVFAQLYMIHACMALTTA